MRELRRTSSRVCQYVVPNNPGEICGRALSGRGRWKWCEECAPAARKLTKGERALSDLMRWRSRNPGHTRIQRKVQRLFNRLQTKFGSEHGLLFLQLWRSIFNIYLKTCRVYLDRQAYKMKITGRQQYDPGRRSRQLGSLGFDPNSVGLMVTAEMCIILMHQENVANVVKQAKLPLNLIYKVPFSGIGLRFTWLTIDGREFPFFGVPKTGAKANHNTIYGLAGGIYERGKQRKTFLKGFKLVRFFLDTLSKILNSEGITHRHRRVSETRRSHF